MRRVTCHQFGSLSDLTVDDVDPPMPGAGQVLVTVHAAGTTYVDALIASGGYQIKPPLPFTPGTEFAGVVAAVGEGVQDVAVGDRVLAYGLAGAFAEQVVVPVAAVIPVPEQVDLVTASTIGQSYSTVAYEFLRRDPLRGGESVLVLGAGGGIGLAAVDLASALGANVIAAASSPEKLAAAKAAGAASTIDYSTEDLKGRARELGGGGIDVVVDPVGGEYAEPALRSLRFDGRYHVVGFTTGTIPRIPLNLVLLSNRTVVGIEQGAWAARNPALQRTLLLEVLGMVADGRLHPARPQERPLGDAAVVLQSFLDRQVVGKIALVP